MTGHAIDEQQRKALEEFKDALTTETERHCQKARALMRAKTDEEAWDRYAFELSRKIREWEEKNK